MLVVLGAPAQFEGALVAVALDLTLELVQQSIDRSLIGRRRFRGDKMRAFRVDDASTV